MLSLLMLVLWKGNQFNSISIQNFFSLKIAKAHRILADGIQPSYAAWLNCVARKSGSDHAWKKLIDY